MTARRGRRRKQLLHKLKGKSYCNFEDQALYCTLRRMRFGRRYAHTARKIT